MSRNGSSLTRLYLVFYKHPYYVRFQRLNNSLVVRFVVTNIYIIY